MSFTEIRSIFHIEKWPSDIRRPAWDDLKDNRIPVQNATFDNVLSCLKGKRIALILGPASRGKTFTGYWIAFHMIEREPEDWVVRYASASDVRYDDEVEDVRVRHDYQRTKSLYIIDDCHKDPTNAGRFLDWALRAGGGNCHFLFIIRGLSEDELDEPFSLLISRGCIIPLTPDLPHIKDIIKAYIDCIRHKYPKSIYITPSDAELEQFIEEKVGTDLDRLMRFLAEAWDPNKKCLKDANEDKIFTSVWRKFGLDNVERRQLLALLSALGQFDVHVYAPFVESLPSAEKIQEVIREGHVVTIAKRRGRPSRFFALAAPKDCEYILKAVTQAQGTDLQEASTELIKQYVRSKPPNTTLVFYALWIAGKKELIKKIFEDTQAMAALQESLVGCGKTIMHQYVKFIEIVSSDLARKLLSHARLRQELLAGEKGAPAYRIQTILPALSTVINLRELFADWSPSDYKKTINSAQLNSLKILFYSLEKWNLPDIAIQFAEQLPGTRLTRLLDPAQGASLTELNNLMGNLRFISSTIGPFFRKLAATDVSILISKAEAKDVRWLLWQMLLLDYPSASRFVRHHANVLAEVLARSKPPYTFWVLWNVFQCDKGSARTLVKIAGSAKVLHEQIALTEAPTINLACLGLLYLCKRKAADVSLPPDRLDGIVKAINNENDGALAALSVKALMLTLKKKKLFPVKTNVDLAVIRLRVNTFPVAETKQCLLDVLDEVALLDVP